MEDVSEQTRAIFASCGERGTIPGEWRGFSAHLFFGIDPYSIPVIIRFYGGSFHGFVYSPTLGLLGSPFLRSKRFEDICSLMHVCSDTLRYIPD